MKVSHYLLVLAALTGAASTLVIKKHVYVSKVINWSKAQEYCRENYVDLSVIDTLEEYNRFKTHVTAAVGWIGLSRNLGVSKYTQWCDGTALNFTMWSIYEPSGGEEKCVYRLNNTWNDYSCDMPMAFYCYSEVIVVEEKKTWVEALEHCRTYYTDLISVTTETDLLVVNNINNNLTASFWTGLHFMDGSWFWVNMEPLGSLVSLPSCPNPPFLCGARKTGANIWENRNCREKMYFACYRQGRE